MIKKLFIDTETSGVDENKHQIWQISCAMTDENNSILSKFNCIMEVEKEWDDYVLNNMLPESYNHAEKLSQSKGYYAFIAYLKRYVNPFNRNDKLFFYAYNSQFDNKFIRQLFLANNDKFFGSYFWTPSIDVMALAGEYLQAKRKNMLNFKLETVANELGLKFNSEDLHDAEADINLTIEVYKAIKNEQKSR